MLYFKVFLLFLSPHPLSPSYTLFLPLSFYSLFPYSGFPGGSAVKNLPAMQETWVCYVGQEDPVEEEMGTHSSILAWEMPWTQRSLVSYSALSHRESDVTQRRPEIIIGSRGKLWKKKNKQI